MNLNKISCQKYVSSIHCSILSPILQLSVKFESQICHENINKPVDGTYLADFGIDIRFNIKRKNREIDNGITYKSQILRIF